MWHTEYMGKEGYRNYLQSEDWKSVHERLDNNDKFKFCKICHSDKNIHLHHRSYRNLRNKGHTLKKNLIPLCSDCHKALHEWLGSCHGGNRLYTAVPKFIKYLKNK